MMRWSRVHGYFVIPLVFSCLCWCLDEPRRSSTVSLSSLTVENEVEPLGIDVLPRFSWIISSPQIDDTQTSYRLRVSPTSTPSKLLWDTGVIASKKSFLVEYGGAKLTSDTQYSWTVDVTTRAGATTSSSKFTTGLANITDWGESLWIGKPTPDDGPTDDLISAFRSASWIWTPESDPPNAPAVDRVFRKEYTVPSDKSVSSAQVLITADDQFIMYTNGIFVGVSPTTANIWQNAQFFNFSLSAGNTSTIAFAVRVTNLPDVNTGGPSPAGLLAAIKVVFSDGTSTLTATDATWISNKIISNDWNAPDTDTSTWSASTVISPYGQGPWGNQVSLPASISTPSLSFSQSSWIWSAEANPSLSPPDPRAFRKTFNASDGRTLESALVIITVDDGFQLYVDGNVVGSSPNETDIWKSAQQFTVPLSGTSVLFAVHAINLPDVNNGGGTPAGLLSAIQITYTDGSTETVVSDATWKVQTVIPDGFEEPGMDDSSWPFATSLGMYGVSPWGTQVSISQSLTEHPAPLLRKEFQISKPLSFAPSDHVLTPGFTKYDTETEYVSLDVVSALSLGGNAIGIELGRSHYGVTQGNVWNWDKTSWHGEPRVRMVLSLGFKDGSTQRVVSDDTWQVVEGPTRLDDVFGGENFDASYIQHGFDQPGFNASSWANAAIMSAPTNNLVSQNQPPTRIVQSMTPINITQPLPGVFVAHFERVVAGWIRLTASGPAKSLITIHFGEKLNPDGTVVYQDTQHYYANNFQTDRFWLAGTGSPETFEPKFSYKGYQYVQIFGWPGSDPPTPNDIIGRVVHDDLAPRGGFQSSNDLLNKMHAAAVYTLLNNVHSIPTDCPTFEKNGWSGDAMLGTEMFLANLNSQDLLAKYVRDLDESRPNGSGPPGVIAPDSGWGANNQAPTWHSAFVFIPWWIYQYRGDTRVLANHYASMKNYVEFELGRSPNNIANTGLGDWDTPETSPLGGNPPEDPRVSATAFLYQMLTVRAKRKSRGTSVR